MRYPCVKVKRKTRVDRDEDLACKMVPGLAAAGLTRLNLVPSYRDGKKSFMRVTVETMPETTTGINHGCAESLLAAGSACQHG